MSTITTSSLRTLLVGLLVASLMVAIQPLAANAQFQIIPDCRPSPYGGLTHLEDVNNCKLYCSQDCRNATDQAACTTYCEELRECELPVCDVSTIIVLIVNIYNYLLWLASFVALLFVIWGGVRMFLIGFSEQPEEYLTAAKNTVRRALAGLVIILTAFLVVNTLLYFLNFQFSGAPPFATVPWFLDKFGISG